MYNALKLSFLVFTLFFALNLHAQQTKVQFYKDAYLTKEVAEGRGNWKVTTTQDTDGSVTQEIRNIHTGEYRAQRDHVNIGKWILVSHGQKETLDYDFDVQYTNDSCGTSTRPAIELNGKDSANEKVFHFIRNILLNKLEYPEWEIDNHIQGTVFLHFTVGQDHSLQNIQVYRSAEKGLDKEAVRILRSIQLPPDMHLLTGSCYRMPITFMLL